MSNVITFSACKSLLHTWNQHLREPDLGEFFFFFWNKSVTERDLSALDSFWQQRAVTIWPRVWGIQNTLKVTPKYSRETQNHGHYFYLQQCDIPCKYQQLLPIPKCISKVQTDVVCKPQFALLFLLQTRLQLACKEKFSTIRTYLHMNTYLLLSTLFLNAEFKTNLGYLMIFAVISACGHRAMTDNLHQHNDVRVP